MTEPSAARYLVKLPPDYYDGLAQRIGIIADKADGDLPFARLCGNRVSASAVRKWRLGMSQPTADRLLIMALTAGVSPTWLLTGEEGHQPDAPLDVHRLAGILVRLAEMLRDVEAETGKTLSPEKQAQWVATLYQLAGSSPDSQKIARPLIKPV